jgi:hypothetical protein
MKKMLLIFGTIAATGLSAQPTLTFPYDPGLLENTPTFHICPSVDEGPAGENQFWDFSMVVSELSQSGSFAEPADTPFGNNYPEADLVGVVPDSQGTTYIYYDFASDGVYTLGLEISGVGSQPYSDPRQDLITPITYLDTYSDIAIFTNNSGPVLVSNVSNFSVDVDGYGTIVTPGGTYENALRLHSIEVTESTIDVGIGEPIVNTSEIEAYIWIIDGYPIPVFQTFEQTLGGIVVNEGSRYVTGTPLSTKEYNTLSGVKLYPVPAVDFVNLDMGDNQTDAATVRIFDIRGAVVKEFAQGMAQVTRFDISDLPSGFYSLNIQTEEGMATKHFTK